MHADVSQDEGRDGSTPGEASSVPAQSFSPRLLYLDMNVWVDMARGCAGSDSAWVDTRAQLIQATQDGQLVVPLSPAHYLELWHRRDNASRRRVAELMRDVTGYATIPSPHVVRQREADAVVKAWAEPNAPSPTPPDLLGRGAAHAFGRPDGRFRFVESVASPDGEVPEGPATQPPVGWEQLREHPDWEWFQLYGMDEVIPEDTGFDRAPEHRFGSSELDHELRVRDWLRTHPGERSRHYDMVVAEEFLSIREYVEVSCRERQVPPPEPLRTGNWGPDSAEAMRHLVQSIPSTDVWATLRHLKHRDLNLPWEQHDWTDMWALSVAIPYCDAVVTEKRWAHLATVGGLSRRYGTSIGHGRRAIEAELELVGRD